jgi:hypothetical protein
MSLLLLFRLARSGSGSSISSISDYDYRAQCNPERPLVRVPRDVIRAPTPPPVVQRVVERAPTPEPDIVERVNKKKTLCYILNKV